MVSFTRWPLLHFFADDLWPVPPQQQRQRSPCYCTGSCCSGRTGPWGTFFTTPVRASGNARRTWVVKSSTTSTRARQVNVYRVISHSCLDALQLKLRGNCLNGGEAKLALYWWSGVVRIVLDKSQKRDKIIDGHLSTHCCTVHKQIQLSLVPDTNMRSNKWLLGANNKIQKQVQNKKQDMYKHAVQ